MSHQSAPSIPFGRPMIGEQEKAAVAEVLDGPILVHGPRTQAFEDAFAAFTGAPHAISVSSCTAGMHLIYFALGLGPGDEVIVPAQTHVATAHAVELTGARAIFVDADAETGNIDINAIEAAITPRTRAIAVVHYLGVPVAMDRINAITGRHSLFVLEDCALAPGARVNGQHVGLLGDAGVFSFYPVKHFTTAEGGMIILRDPALAAKLRLIRAFGVDRTHGERKVPGVYDVVALGFNYRMSEIHAALGVEQLKKLPDFLAQRQRNFEHLADLLAPLPGLRVLSQPLDHSRHSCHYCLAVLLDDNRAPRRPDIIRALTQRGIGSSVYYPHPVPRLTYYAEKYGDDLNRYPMATRLSDGMIALPVGPHLGTDEMDTIAEQFTAVWRQINDR